MILTFAGGLGLIAYLLCLAFVPTDDPAAPPLKWGLARTIGAGLLAVAALALWCPTGSGARSCRCCWWRAPWSTCSCACVRDDGGKPRRPRGRADRDRHRARSRSPSAASSPPRRAPRSAAASIVAGLVIACGVGLVGGAFRGGARWLIVPALVLALPLGAVAATDLDIRGTWGDRTFHPASVAELADGYDMGVGSLRSTRATLDLPPGRTDLRVEIGMGEIEVLVPAGRLRHDRRPRSASASSNAGDGDQGGVDLDIDDDRAVAPGVTQLHVIADVGIGAVHVGDRFVDAGRPGGRPASLACDFEVLRSPASRAACMGTA